MGSLHLENYLANSFGQFVRPGPQRCALLRFESLLNDRSLVLFHGPIDIIYRQLTPFI